MTSRLLLPLMIGALISCFSFGQKPVNAGKSNSFFIQGGNYYYIQNGNRLASGKHKLKGVKGELVICNELIAVDEEKVFYRYLPQWMADRETFVVEGHVKKDKNQVYSLDFFNFKAVPFADPSTFIYLVMDSSNAVTWARDRYHYFLNHQVIDVDYSSFQLLNFTIAYDKSHVYMSGGTKLLTMADTDSLPEKLTRYFCKDNRFIYYYSYKNGFSKIPVTSLAAIDVITEHEIRVNGNVISAYR